MSIVFKTDDTNRKIDEAAKYYALNSQQDLQVERTRKIADAMKNPSDYYTKRAAALDGVKTESSNHFASQYEKLIKLNVPHLEAIARATKLADGMRALLLTTVNDEWPADVANLSLRMMRNKSGGAVGFIHPDASLPSATAGGKRKRK